MKTPARVSLTCLLLQIQGIEELYVFDGGSVTVDTNGSIWMSKPSGNNLKYLLLQIQGIEDLFVFDGGSVTVDTNGSIGMSTPARVSLKSLHVQDKGTFEMDAYSIDNMFEMDATNITVSIDTFTQF